MTDNEKEKQKADRAYIRALKCITPGCCTCPRMKRCPGCGYTEHDKVHLMDHQYCSIEKKKRK